jgi:hypothetical protein
MGRQLERPLLQCRIGAQYQKLPVWSVSVLIRGRRVSLRSCKPTVLFPRESESWLGILSTQSVAGDVNHGVVSDVGICWIGVQIGHHISENIAVEERENLQSKRLTAVSRKIISQ